MLRGDPERLLDTVDSLADGADCDPVTRRVVDVLFAVPIAGHGLWWMIRQRAPFPSGFSRFGGYGRPFWTEVHGTAAVGIGVAAVSVTVFPHTHACWSAHPRWHGRAAVAKAVAAAGVVGGPGTLVWAVLAG